MRRKQPAARRSVARTQARRPTRARAVPTPDTPQVRTLKAQTRFLRDFAMAGVILRSARAAAIGRRTVYDWLRGDEAFKALYVEAEADAKDALLEEARRRAVDGWLEPVYQGGDEVGRVRKYSDALLTTLLKGKLPETFRERFEHTGAGGGPIVSNVNLYTLAIPDNGRART
jgi:hypothetical protein